MNSNTTIKPYQEQFIAFALQEGVLQFGEFTLKSGRVSPYFFNAGLFNTGANMLKLSRFFAQSINDSNIAFDVLFGPAYKGITLSCATAMALSELTGNDVPYAYNRKEKKDHGEGGSTVGAKLEGNIAIIDDVITAGTAIRESFSIIANANAQTCAVFLTLDRQERGQKEDTVLDYSAVQQVQNEFKTPVVSIANMDCIIQFVENDKKYATYLADMLAYRKKYGIQN